MLKSAAPFLLMVADSRTPDFFRCPVHHGSKAAIDFILEDADDRHIIRYIGHRMRKRRQEIRIFQDAIAPRIGVTFQQVQKYERGVNRI